LLALLAYRRRQTARHRLAAEVDQLTSEGEQIVGSMSRPVATPTETAVRDGGVRQRAAALLPRIQGAQGRAADVDERAAAILRDLSEQTRRVAQEAERSEAVHTASGASQASFEYAEASLRQAVDQLSGVLSRARAWLRSTRG
jgi:hypothetical protein